MPQSAERGGAKGEKRRWGERTWSTPCWKGIERCGTATGSSRLTPRTIDSVCRRRASTNAATILSEYSLRVKERENVVRAVGTRERILAAARAVMLKKGLVRATTKEIARAADVSEGTLYNHFASK